MVKRRQTLRKINKSLFPEFIIDPNAIRPAAKIQHRRWGKVNVCALGEKIRGGQQARNHKFGELFVQYRNEF